MTTASPKTIDDLSPDQMRNLVDALNCDNGRLQDFLGYVLGEEETFRLEVQALLSRVRRDDLESARPLADALEIQLHALRTIKAPHRAQLIDVGGDDGFTMQMSAPNWAMRLIGENFGRTLGSAKNYSECRMSFPGFDFCVTIQRIHGKSPHELQKQAEAERDAALTELARLRGEEPAIPTTPPKKAKGRRPKFIIDGKTKEMVCNTCGGREPLTLPTDNLDTQVKPFKAKHRGCKPTSSPQ